MVETPFAAAPHECFGAYEPFFRHLDAYAEATKADPEGGVQTYLKRYYEEPEDWNDYLTRLGMGEVLDAARRGRSIYND